MLRSEVNRALEEGEAFIASCGLLLPPFASLAPEEMAAPERAPLRELGLGWDVTDYGAGRFAELGLLLFTLRNGRAADLAAGRGRLYAEKALVVREGQLSPMHRHVVKAEDIIHRGGAGRLVLTLFASRPDGSRDEEAPAEVWVDALPRRVPAGGRVALGPGEGITLMPGTWHDFTAEGGDVLCAEVSTVNDDRTDNVFDPPLPRFSSIEEDAPPRRLLVSDY